MVYGSHPELRSCIPIQPMHGSKRGFVQWSEFFVQAALELPTIPASCFAVTLGLFANAMLFLRFACPSTPIISDVVTPEGLEPSRLHRRGVRFYPIKLWGHMSGQSLSLPALFKEQYVKDRYWWCWGELNPAFSGFSDQHIDHYVTAPFYLVPFLSDLQNARSPDPVLGSGLLAEVVYSLTHEHSQSRAKQHEQYDATESQP